MGRQRHENGETDCNAFESLVVFQLGRDSLLNGRLACLCRSSLVGSPQMSRNHGLEGIYTSLGLFRRCLVLEFQDVADRRFAATSEASTFQLALALSLRGFGESVSGVIFLEKLHVGEGNSGNQR